MGLIGLDLDWAGTGLSCLLSCLTVLLLSFCLSLITNDKGSSWGGGVGEDKDNDADDVSDLPGRGR